MISPDQLKRYALTHEVLEYVKSNYALFVTTYDALMTEADEEYLDFAEHLLGTLRRKSGSDEAFRQSLQAFIRYSHEYLLLQIKLKRTGHYLYSSFAEVDEKVYQDPSMEEYYLDGQMLSHVLWPNHFRLHRWLLEQKGISHAETEVLDVPCGPGIYPYCIGRYLPYRRLISVDISPYARDYARRLLACSDFDTTRITVDLSNVYDLDEERLFDLIVCGELLEHLEEPRTLLAKLRRLVRPTGAVFLTTAIFAAARDHIYLFNNAHEVRQMLEEYFQVSSELVLPLSLKRYHPDMNREPMNYAAVLRPKP